MSLGPHLLAPIQLAFRPLTTEPPIFKGERNGELHAYTVTSAFSVPQHNLAGISKVVGTYKTDEANPQRLTVTFTGELRLSRQVAGGCLDSRSLRGSVMPAALPGPMFRRNMSTDLHSINAAPAMPCALRAVASCLCISHRSQPVPRAGRRCSRRSRPLGCLVRWRQPRVCGRHQRASYGATEGTRQRTAGLSGDGARVADDPQQLRFHCAAQGGRVKQCKGAGCGPPACLCCAVLRATPRCLFFSHYGFVFAMPERELQPAILAASFIHSCILYQHTLSRPVRRTHLPIVSQDALSYRNRSNTIESHKYKIPTGQLCC